MSAGNSSMGRTHNIRTLLSNSHAWISQYHTHTHTHTHTWQCRQTLHNTWSFCNTVPTLVGLEHTQYLIPWTHRQIHQPQAISFHACRQRILNWKLVVTKLADNTGITITFCGPVWDKRGVRTQCRDGWPFSVFIAASSEIVPICYVVTYSYKLWCNINYTGPMLYEFCRNGVDITRPTSENKETGWQLDRQQRAVSQLGLFELDQCLADGWANESDAFNAPVKYSWRWSTTIHALTHWPTGILQFLRRWNWQSRAVSATQTRRDLDRQQSTTFRHWHINQ